MFIFSKVDANEVPKANVSFMFQYFSILNYMSVDFILEHSEWMTHKDVLFVFSPIPKGCCSKNSLVTEIRLCLNWCCNMLRKKILIIEWKKNIAQNPLCLFIKWVAGAMHKRIPMHFGRLNQFSHVILSLLLFGNSLFGASIQIFLWLFSTCSVYRNPFDFKLSGTQYTPSILSPDELNFIQSDCV